MASIERSRMTPVVVSSVPPMISSSWSRRCWCSIVTRSPPSSIVIIGLPVEHRLDVRVVQRVIDATDRENGDVVTPTTSRAAVASCVDNGFDAHRATSAPPAFSVRMRLAVSVVTWRHAAIVMPSSGFSFSNRSRMRCSTGICRSAHSILRRPSSARARSWTSYSTVICFSLLLLRKFGFEVLEDLDRARVDPVGEARRRSLPAA